MKLISDFDGVLTELSREAVRVEEIFLEKWRVSLAGTGLDVEALWSASQAAMEQSPGENGWEVRERISAYADEDDFIRNQAIACWLDRQGTSVSRHIQALKRKGYVDFKTLMHEAYYAMAEEVLHGTVTPIDPATAHVAEAITNEGVDIVVTSNSGTERILDIFKKNSIAATAHPEIRSKTLRVRGAARKFELTEKMADVRVIEFGGRRVETSRPDYEGILREERPDAVMGDVFSFDLATPLALARSAPELFPSGLKLILRRRDYTPPWVLDGFVGGREKNVEFFVIDRLEDLPGLLASL